jgi:hypothetical protein
VRGTRSFHKINLGKIKNLAGIKPKLLDRPLP